jgi:MFS transporter, ACS family, glucarate transporter
MPSDQNSVRPTKFRWTVFVLACGTSWMLYLHRYIFGLIKPTLVEEYGLSKTELGLLDSGFAVFYSSCQVPMGIAVDAIGVHLLLTLMIVVWCVGLALHAWAPSKEDLWYGRAVLGAGQSGVFAALSRVTRNWFPISVRTTVQGWVGVFFGRIGGMSANLLVGSLILGVYLVPWRTAVYGLSAIGIVYAVVFALLYRNTPRQHPYVNNAEADLIEASPTEVPQHATKKLTIRQMFTLMSPRSIRNLLTLNVQTILSTIADNIFSAWIPLFLVEVHGLKFKEMGIYAALPLLGGACGGAVGGWLNDLMIRRTGSLRWSRTTIGMAGKGMAAILLATALLWYDDPYTFCSLLFFVKFFSDWSLTTTWGAVTDIGGRSTATVFAFNNSVASIGAILAPAMYGAVAEHFSWPAVFLTGAAAYLLCALSWLLIDCRIPVIAEDHE